MDRRAGGWRRQSPATRSDTKPVLAMRTLLSSVALSKRVLIVFCCLYTVAMVKLSFQVAHADAHHSGGFSTELGHIQAAPDESDHRILEMLESSPRYERVIFPSHLTDRSQVGSRRLIEDKKPRAPIHDSAQTREFSGIVQPGALPRNSHSQPAVIARRNNVPQRKGFMVLGMHRSGTSMLTGLLSTAFGYNSGGPLFGPGFGNAKGLFERIDVVNQNDEFMDHQDVWWSTDVVDFNYRKALEAYEAREVGIKEGRSALAFFKDPSNAPWIQKDPRMCVTLKTWLKLMRTEPAIVFTYRHPLEVAMSLKHRDKFPLDRGLGLWIAYNALAIQNSKGLCIVYSSNEAVLDDPIGEGTRISNELTSKCGVPQPLRSHSTPSDFVDPTLQRRTRERKAKEDHTLPIIDTYNDGKCLVRDFATDSPSQSAEAKRERRLYKEAMRIYCDLQSGKAYEDDYEWPRLQ